MANAPTPGSAGTTGGNEKVTAAQQTVTILLRKPVPTGPDGNAPSTVVVDGEALPVLTTIERKNDGETTETVDYVPHVEVVRTLNIGAVPFSERSIVRRATKMPWEEFMVNDYGMSVGLDTIQVWWWLACRAAGKPMLTLTKSLEDWPESPDADTFVIIHDDGEEDDSPEG